MLRKLVLPRLAVVHNLCISLIFQARVVVFHSVKQSLSDTHGGIARSGIFGVIHGESDIERTAQKLECIQLANGAH